MIPNDNFVCAVNKIKKKAKDVHNVGLGDFLPNV
jgi:hypothetical protein